MKNGIKSFVKIVSIIMCLFFSANFFSACSKKSKGDSSFAVTGYVYDELGNAVEGVDITSDFITTTTDKDGKYTISGLEGSLVLSANKEGYVFETSSKYITSSNDDANFVAYKKYTVTGTAHNNEIAVPNANIVVSSLAGEFYTTTNEFGTFMVTGVAGKTEVSCEIDNLQFYTATANIESPEVAINTTSSLTLNFAEENGKAIDFSKLELWVNGFKTYLSSDVKVLKNIRCGTVVEIKSNYYNIGGERKFVVEALNQTENFVLSKIYGITGTVKSGTTPLAGASIYIDGKLSATAGETGFFDIPHLWSERSISVEYAGFDFSTLTSNETSTTFSFNGTKEISFVSSYDHKLANDLTFNVQTEVERDGVYKVKNVSLGDVITVGSSNYHVNKQTYVVDNSNSYNIELFAKYTPQISGLDSLDAAILLDGVQVEQSALVNFYGTHTISATYQNYVFSSAEVSFTNPVANLTYQAPYNVSLTIKSGDLLISNAEVSVDEKSSVYSNEAGNVTLENLVSTCKLNISASGYNAQTIEVSNASNLIVNLTYNVSGVVKTGDAFVSQATVSAQEKTTQTNSKGYFEIIGLYGEVEVFVQKENFEFQTSQIAVTQENLEIEFIGTYSISGVLTSEEIAVSTFKINLKNLSSGTVLSQTTQDGTYEFTNLSGRYFLYVESSNGTIGILKPNSYNVSSAGTYNFSSSGFSVSGYIKTGDIPVVGAKVTAGAQSVYTNASGYYVFELITSPCDVSAEMAGYVFSEKVHVSEDASNVNFSATYTVSGSVKIDGIGLEGVSVYSNEENNILATTDANGNFTISGLSGLVPLDFSKTGYQFNSNIEVSSSTLVVIEKDAIKIKASVTVKTGSLDVTGFKYFIGTRLIGTSNSSSFEVLVNYGDIIYVEKEGYSFSGLTITQPMAYNITATYSVSCVVSSGDVPIEDFEVYLNGQKVNAYLSGNTFTLSLLSGQNEITIKKAGFNFNLQTVSGYQQNVTFNATYNIEGYVYIGSKVLSGVVVTLNEQTSVTTDATGRFEFNSVSGKYSLTAQKEGYSFSSITNKFGSSSVTIDGYYTISGVVKSGTLLVSDATVCVTGASLSADKYATTDANGRFSVIGITGQTSVIITKAGYHTVTVSGYSDTALTESYNMKYSVTLNFDVEGVTVSFNGSKIELSGKTYTNSNLEGSVTFVFSKPNRIIRPSSVLTTTGPAVLNFESEEAYRAYGYVTTQDNIPVQNVLITTANGDKFAYTDKNGYYELLDVAGEIILSNEYITRDVKDVKSEQEYSFTISTADFATFLYGEAIKKLDGAASVQIYGKGTVIGTAVGFINTTQNVLSVFKRDTKGNIVRQNLNYGSEAAGIDPKVSLVAVYTNFNGSATKSWKYQHLVEGDVVSTEKAKHTPAGLKPIDAGTYESTYGSNPHFYSVYKINPSTATLKSISSSGDYVIDFTLNTEAQDGYKQQILKLAPDGTKFNGFSSINIKITIDSNGWIKEMYAEDNYEIHQKVPVTIVSKITYKFHTNKSNLAIDDIAIIENETNTESNSLLTALKLSAQTEIAASTYSFKKYDVVSQTIYGNL